VQPLSETKVFPPMVVQMIGVGEATGAMDQMLTKIADFYDDEVDAAVAALTSLIEPGDDGLPRRSGRRLPHRHVSAHLLHRRRGQVNRWRRRRLFALRRAPPRRAFTEAGPADRASGWRWAPALPRRHRWPTLGHDAVPANGGSAASSPSSPHILRLAGGNVLLRTRRISEGCARADLAADVIAATGSSISRWSGQHLHVCIAGDVSRAIGLGRRGGALGASASCVAFCLLAWSMQSASSRPPWGRSPKGE